MRSEVTIHDDCPGCKALQQEIQKLKSTIEDRKKIEQAKWILVKTKKLSEEEAHKLLQTSSRRQNKSIRDMAEAIITGERLLGAISL